MKAKDIKTIDQCNLCTKYHARPHLEYICYENRFPRFSEMPDKEKLLAELRAERQNRV